MEKQTEKRINKDLILRERLALERTIMTNNTTLLSFIRTALYFSVAGLSINNLLKIRYGVWIEFSCWVIAIVIFVVGVFNYLRQKRKIKDSERHIGDYKLDYESDL